MTPALKSGSRSLGSLLSTPGGGGHFGIHCHKLRPSSPAARAPNKLFLAKVDCRCSTGLGGATFFGRFDHKLLLALFFFSNTFLPCASSLSHLSCFLSQNLSALELDPRVWIAQVSSPFSLFSFFLGLFFFLGHASTSEEYFS